MTANRSPQSLGPNFSNSLTLCLLSPYILRLLDDVGDIGSDHSDHTLFVLLKFHFPFHTIFFPTFLGLKQTPAL